MTLRKDKLYPHITGVLGDEGENPGVLAVHAVLDPSEHYPEDGRIIVGSPTQSTALPGYLPDLGGFATGIAGAERLIATLQQAVSDIRAATGRAVHGVWDHPPYLMGFHRIGRLDAVGRRSLWLKEEQGAFELRAGREGDDAHVRVTSENPQYEDLASAMGCARFAAEYEEANGLALAPLGIEHYGYETPLETVTSDPSEHTTVFTFRDAGRDQRFRVIVRHGRHFAVQYPNAGDPDFVDPATQSSVYWESVTKMTTGIAADQVMALLLGHLGAAESRVFQGACKMTAGGVTTIDLGDIT